MSIAMIDPDGQPYHAEDEADAMEHQLHGYSRVAHQQRAYVPEPDAQAADRAYVPPADEPTPEQAAVTPTGGDAHPADAAGQSGDAEQQRRRRS